MKFTLKKELPSFLLLALAWIAGWYFFQHFPDRVVSHWNFYGQPDGWSGKTANAWGFPGLLTFMWLLLTFLPYLDPKKERYQEFEKVYRIFKNLILAVVFIIMLAGGLYNLGYNIKIQYVVPATVGLLMIVMGNYMGKLKPNWFVGIRTPWTISSENVWNKTHRMGGYMFVIFGLLIIVTPLLPQTYGLIAFGLGIFLVIFATLFYSYWVYRKEKTKTA